MHRCPVSPAPDPHREIRRRPPVRRSGDRRTQAARYRAASIAASGLPHAYTGVTNILFLRAGGTVDDYAAGCAFATAKKWFEIDRSGTRIVLLPDGAE